MTYKKIALSVCTVTASLLLSACGGGSSGSTVTGVFEASVVENLPYSCSPSGETGTTDSNGGFTCKDDEEISFHLGQTILGPIDVEEVITPYKLFPKDEESAIRLTQLLLSLDDDGNYDSVITLIPELLEDIITGVIDFNSNTFEDDVQAMLDDANLTLVDAQTAEDHLHASDTEIPVVTLLGEPEVIIEVGNVYMDPGATAYDEFEGVLDPVRTGTVDTNTIGIYMYTYTATDSAGNVGTATRQIVVLDTTAPVVTLNGDSTVTISVGDSYTDEGATAIDNYDGALTAEMSGSVNTTVAGTYTITWTATDSSGNVGTAIRTVIVEAVDVTPPVITLNGDNPMYVTLDGTFTDPGATATDNVDGSVAVSVSGTVDTTTAGSYILTYSATDTAGNTGTAIRTVIVQDTTQDTTPPVVTLNGDNPMYLFVNGTFTDPGATATDDVDGNVAVSVSGTVDTTTAGSYTLTYSATDTAGNTGTATRTVTVVECQTYNPITGECEDELPGGDTVEPVVTLNGDNPMYLFVNGTFTDPGATATDDVDGNVAVSVSGTVDTTTAGSYTLTYSATDTAGNTGTATRTVTVVECQTYNPITGECEDELPGSDTTAPVVTLIGEATVQVDGNSTYEDAGATATDDVDGALTPVKSGSVDTSVVDTYSVTWTATDAAGNEGSATRTVEVVAVSTECQVYNPITGLCED